MTRSTAVAFATLCLFTAGPAAWAQGAPAAASANQAGAAGTFIQTLADQVFGVLRDPAQSDAERDARFRAMLRENFAIRSIGDRLIRRHRATISPAQYAAYTAAFPDFVVSTYGDRLESYRTAKFRVTRSLDRGAAGIDVFTRVTPPGGGAPFESTWNVRRLPSGRFVIANLTVAGVNLALTQEADFSSYIQRNGFDGLVAFMRRGQPAAAR